MSQDGVRGPARAVLLLGGTSEIGLATVHALALGPGSTVFLCGRDSAGLRSAAGTFHDGVNVVTDQLEALDPDSVAAVINRAFDTTQIDIVLPAFGVLGNQATFELEPSSTAALLTINVTSQVRALLEAAKRLRLQGHGTLVVLSSIAGVRPRRANFVYGAAKAALDAFAQGLADSLHGSGVRVLLVRPGFVTGRMTQGMRPAPMATTPPAVGRAIASAIDDPKAIVWVPR